MRRFESHSCHIFSTISQETDIHRKCSEKKEVKSITEHTQIKIYQENYQRGRMAEWFKELRLGRSIFGCVGSNPTPVTYFLQTHRRLISTRNYQKSENRNNFRAHLDKNSNKKIFKEAGWPSGLRRCIYAAVSSDAWVRLPLP